MIQEKIKLPASNYQRKNQKTIAFYGLKGNLQNLQTKKKLKRKN